MALDLGHAMVRASMVMSVLLQINRIFRSKGWVLAIVF